MKLQLPHVTLLQMETQNHRLAKLAVDDCLAAADFGEVLILSDSFSQLRVPGASHYRVENWPNKLGYAKALWHVVPLYVKTAQVLIIQWDSWIIRPELWRPEFSSYDYIGAPWHYEDGFDVGNSGFSLRSNALMQFLLANKLTYPPVQPAEDELLSRLYRTELEKHGFVWAPKEVAVDFSREGYVPDGLLNSFGFHGTFNWHKVLGPDQFEERIKLAASSPYIRRSGMLDEVIRLAPWAASAIKQAA
jgi:hypothetical protein